MLKVMIFENRTATHGRMTFSSLTHPDTVYVDIYPDSLLGLRQSPCFPDTGAWQLLQENLVSHAVEATAEQLTKEGYYIVNNSFGR